MNSTITQIVNSSARQLTEMIPTFSTFTSSGENSTAEITSSFAVYENYEDNSTMDYRDLLPFERCVYERHGAIFLPVLYAIFFTLGFLGNCLVIWVIVFGTRLRSMTDVCLLNLAVADLLLVCSLPFVAHQARDQWLFGDAMCKIILGIFSIAFYSGIFFVSLMSIDRYLAVVHAVYAMRARTRSYGMIAAAVSWLAGCLASFPDLIFFKQHPEESSPQFCYSVYPTAKSQDTGFNDHFWTLFSLFKMNILGLFLPAVVMFFCYSQIILRLLYCQSPKKQAIRLVLVVVATFFCCWLPYNIASFFKALELLHIYEECDSSKNIRLALQVTEAIAYSHSCLNPILYVFAGEKFRRHLLRMISRTPYGLCRMIAVCLPHDRISGSVISQTSILDERSTVV